MKVSQRQIVEVPFNLPQGILHHPVIVLSNDNAIIDEDCFIGLMLTTEKTNDEYTFEITPEMLVKKLKVPFCQARIHLIGFFRCSEIVMNSNWNNQIKTEYFENLIEQIISITFGLE